MAMSRSEAGKLGALKSLKTIQEKSVAFRKAYANNPKCCLGCAEPLLFGKKANKFCSRSCAARYNNLGKIKNPIGRNGVAFTPGPPRVKLDACKHCSKPLGASQRQYCSRSCCGQYKWAKTKEQIRLGKISHPQRIRKFLLEERPHQCISCGRTEWLGEPIPLEVDHVDGDHKNNDLKNLRLLCPNCHTKTPTYKAKNKGRGRSQRMKRYYEGKSY